MTQFSEVSCVESNTSNPLGDSEVMRTCFASIAYINANNNNNKSTDDADQAPEDDDDDAVVEENNNQQSEADDADQAPAEDADQAEVAQGKLYMICLPEICFTKISY